MDAFNKMMCGNGGRRRKKGSRLGGIRGGANNFTKKDVVKYCAENTGLTQKECKEVFESAVDFIKTFASDTNSSVTITGFGSFRTQEYKYNSKAPNGRTYSGKRKKMVFLPSSSVTSRPKKKN